MEQLPGTGQGAGGPGLPPGSVQRLHEARRPRGRVRPPRPWSQGGARDDCGGARATTGRSDELFRFRERADRYRDALSKPDWSARAVKSIRDGSTFSDIPFAGLDRARREQASSALQTWNAVARLRFPNARRQLRESMDELLRFIGLPLQAHGVEVVDTNQDGFAHIRATLSRPVDHLAPPGLRLRLRRPLRGCRGPDTQGAGAVRGVHSRAQAGRPPGPCVPPPPADPDLPDPVATALCAGAAHCPSSGPRRLPPPCAGNGTACPSCSS